MGPPEFKLPEVLRIWVQVPTEGGGYIHAEL